MINKINKRVFLILSIILTISMFSTPARALWLSGYEYRKEITIDHTKIDSDLSSFPLAVILSDTTNIVDGNDVKFTLADGSTKLDYEKEKYATDDAAYWVNIPAVSSGTDTTFYMYYGKEGDTDESTTAVWDENYAMVQHLEETSGTHYDSTSNANNGTPYGVTQDAAGQIDGADYFSGYVNCGNGASLNINDAITVEAWVKSPIAWSSQANYAGLIRKFNTVSGYGFFMQPSGAISFEIGDGATNHTRSTSTALQQNEWYHISATYDGNTLRLYLNGNEDATPTYGTWGIASTSSPFYIARDWVGRMFNGTVDEVRVSNIARDSAWIEATYNSGNNSLLLFGSEESGVIPEPTSLLLLGFGVTGLTFFVRGRRR